MKDLNNIIATSGLLLTLMTFLLNLFWQKIEKAKGQDTEIYGSHKITQTKKEIQHTLIFIAVPIFIGFLVLFYVNLPTTIQILENSHLKFWDFNVNKTIYVMIELTLSLFVIFNILTIFKLQKKISILNQRRKD